MKKKVLMLVMILVMVFAAGAAYGNGLTESVEALFDSGRIININGNKIDTSETGVLVYKDRTYVPARAVTEALGAKVGWDGVTETITITGPGYVAPITPPPAPVVDATIDFNKKLDLSGLKPIADVYIGNNLTRGYYEGYAVGSMCVLKGDFEEATKTMGWDIHEYGDDTYYFVRIQTPKYTDSSASPRFPSIAAMKKLGPVMYKALEDNGWRYLCEQDNSALSSGWTQDIISDKIFIKGEFSIRLTVKEDRCVMEIYKAVG